MTNRGAECGKAACTVLILPPGESKAYSNTRSCGGEGPPQDGVNEIVQKDIESGVDREESLPATKSRAREVV